MTHPLYFEIFSIIQRLSDGLRESTTKRRSEEQLTSRCKIINLPVLKHQIVDPFLVITNDKQALFHKTKRLDISKLSFCVTMTVREAWLMPMDTDGSRLT